MPTNRIIKLLGIAGIAGVAVFAATLMTRRSGRREAARLHQLNERLEKDRWESEGGASRTGPATPSAVAAH